jgi:hypothetical protein
VSCRMRIEIMRAGLIQRFGRRGASGEQRRLPKRAT